MLSQLIEHLKREEGFRPYVYDDATGQPIVKGSTVEGYPTIAYGACVDAHKGAPIPQRVADLWLEIAAQARFEALIDRIPWLVGQPEEVQIACGSMAYQLGVNGVLGFRRMLAALELGDLDGAAGEMINSRWHSQTPERCERLAKLVREAREHEGERNAKA